MADHRERTSGGASLPSDRSTRLTGRVLRIAGGVYELETDQGLLRASLRGRVKQKDSRLVSVGDLVEIETMEGDARIAALLPRRSALTRHGVARRREQVIVANVDQVAVVVAYRSPQPDLLMVDRLLALAELNRLRSLLVLNKTDLATPRAARTVTGSPDAAPPALPDELAAYAAMDYPIVLASAKTEHGLDELAGRLAGRTTVLAGQSGVGKSSLLNALLPGLDLRVGEVGERKGRGRHTPGAAALYPYPVGGNVADTPGLQYVALWEVDPADLRTGFREIRAAGGRCRFADCRHRAEPGCEVRRAVEEGRIEDRRYRSYLGLLEESEGRK